MMVATSPKGLCMGDALTFLLYHIVLSNKFLKHSLVTLNSMFKIFDLLQTTSNKDRKKKEHEQALLSIMLWSAKAYILAWEQKDKIKNDYINFNENKELFFYFRGFKTERIYSLYKNIYNASVKTYYNEMAFLFQLCKMSLG